MPLPEQSVAAKGVKTPSLHPTIRKSAQRHSCSLTVDMSISGFAAIMPSAVSSG